MEKGKKLSREPYCHIRSFRVEPVSQKHTQTSLLNTYTPTDSPTQSSSQALKDHLMHRHACLCQLVEAWHQVGPRWQTSQTHKDTVYIQYVLLIQKHTHTQRQEHTEP